MAWEKVSPICRLSSIRSEFTLYRSRRSADGPILFLLPALEIAKRQTTTTRLDLWRIATEGELQGPPTKPIHCRPAHLQTLTGETLFLAALHVTVRQNQKEERTLDEILDSKDLCDSSVLLANAGILGIQRSELRTGGTGKRLPEIAAAT
jgi:hypothetical protein